MFLRGKNGMDYEEEYSNQAEYSTGLRNKLRAAKSSVLIQL